ncbi:MAG: hypothetical protein ACYCSB_01435 [bacterium]
MINKDTRNAIFEMITIFKKVGIRVVLSLIIAVLLFSIGAFLLPYNLPLYISVIIILCLIILLFFVTMHPTITIPLYCMLIGFVYRLNIIFAVITSVVYLIILYSILYIKLKKNEKIEKDNNMPLNRARRRILKKINREKKS